MSDNINLDVYADSCLEAATYGVRVLDINELREKAQDAIHNEADNAVIYYHNALEIINRYEREVGEVEDLGGEYKAEDWQKAMVAYAYSVASTWLSSEVSSRIDAIEEAAEALEEKFSDLNSDNEDAELPDVTISQECPHGWASHDSEEDSGDSSLMVWKSGQLDGSNGLAIEAGGIWLSMIFAK